MASEESIKVTAAIDFGTTYSGIAYSHFYNKEAIYFPFWPDGSTSKKVPTAILLDQNAKFLAFGQDAITKYIEKHEEDDEAVNNYFLFHRFKMELYKEKVATVYYVSKPCNLNTIMSTMMFLMTCLFIRQIRFKQATFEASSLHGTSLPISFI